jgi:hypothetical protein
MYNHGLHRILAILLTAVFSLPLITPLLSASAGPQRPACCRKDGKHACAMRKAAPDSGPAVSAVKPACALYPVGNLSFASSDALAAPPCQTAGVALRPSGQLMVRTEHRALTTLGHALPDRGPPTA